MGTEQLNLKSPPKADPPLADKITNFPKQPGVYRFLNKDGGVIYIGKAKNLRSRVSQYFQGNDERPQIPFLMAEATDVDYTVVNNELESLYLENTMIKQHRPKYNILLRDDKNYAFIKIDYSTDIPQIGYARRVDEKGLRVDKINPAPSTPKSKYFGPYTAAYKIRNTLNLVRKIFPFCSAEKVGTRPCFYYYLHRCPGVCIGKISLAEYSLQLKKIEQFLKGDAAKISQELKKEMRFAAKNKKFETAARLRDQLRSLMMLEEKQAVILTKKVDWDIISLIHDQGYSCVNLFKVRAGKLFDKENFVYESAAVGISDGTVLQAFLEQYYLESSEAAKEVFVQSPIENQGSILELIKKRFGIKAKIGSPQKGKLKNLIKLGQTNASEYLKNWLNDKAGNLDKINQALDELQKVLKLSERPNRIECYDISNIQGTNPVGSMVVFVKGLPAKSQYRKFKIQGKSTPDDFAMMKEMLTRRLLRSNQQSVVSSQQSKASNWELPNLMVIDGGKGQLSTAVETINNSQLTINAIGLAKRIEEIFIPNQSAPIILSHDSEALKLLQRLRDETHRFGITFHRNLRSKQAIKSALDDIFGIGPKTKKLLKAKFGTVANIKKANYEELANIVGPVMAKSLKENL